MNLYLLKIDAGLYPRGYDINRGFVIRAASEFWARGEASLRAYDEGSQVWRKTATCELLAENVKGDQRIILADARVH
jgi:hypothetical protein